MPDPLNLPRLDLPDLVYQGSFIVPNGAGASVLAFNPATNTLIAGGERRLAEINIPLASTGPKLSDLATATLLKPWHDPLTLGKAGIGTDVWLGGAIVIGNRLYGSAFEYYDAQGHQRVSHYTLPLPLGSGPSVGYAAIQAPHPRYAAGAMSHVPIEWQSVLGGSALTGQWGIPIVGYVSNAMSAFAFDPLKIAPNVTIPAAGLLYYTPQHPTLGAYRGPGNAIFTSADESGGMAIIPGTRTLLFSYKHGEGKFCYGGQECNDPTSPYQGTHAYPYTPQFAAYDLNDLAKVKAGQMKPWEVKPYAAWPIKHLPFTERRGKFVGMATDAQRQLLYVGQRYAANGGDLVHVFKIAVGSPPPVVPPVVVPPPVDPPVDPPPVDPPPPVVDPQIAVLKAALALVTQERDAVRARIAQIRALVN